MIAQKNLEARLYKRAHVTRKIAVPDTFEAQVLRAVWVHRWLPEPLAGIERALRGDVTGWPDMMEEWGKFGADGESQFRPGGPAIRPRDISLHDKVFGLKDTPSMFMGLTPRAFGYIWRRGALLWSFQKIGDRIGRNKQYARRQYLEAMQHVTANAWRGAYEI